MKYVKLPFLMNIEIVKQPNPFPNHYGIAGMQVLSVVHSV